MSGGGAILLGQVTERLVTLGWFRCWALDERSAKASPPSSPFQISPA